MKKKILLAIIIGIITIGGSKNVYALEDVYYTNPNGIELTQEEYTFLSTFYGEPYVDIMTQEQYDEFIDEDLIHSDVSIKSITIPVSTLPLQYPGASIQSDTHSTPAKTLQIGAGCLPTYCIMSLLNTWHVVPSVKSWDNIGTYISGTSLKSYTHSYVSSTAGTEYFSNLIQSTNGIGNSVNLSNSGNDIVINMAFKVYRNGTVYGSYQHAMTPTTLLVSQKYNIDILGYGNVFLYYGSAVGIYDGMPGVDISV